MIGIKGGERNGDVVAAHAVSDDENVISITSDQQMVRSAVADFSVQGRMAQGVKLVRLSEGATLVSVSVCEGSADGSEGVEGDASGNAPEGETPEGGAPEGGAAE